MGIIMSGETLDKHIHESIAELNLLLQSWLRSESEADHKRAQILAYWIKSYTSMLQREQSFNPASIPRLKRRQIVNVDFGFRIGSELGGLHYAVVLDKQNTMNSNTVTVVPLGSLKANSKISQNKIVLSDGIYAPLSEKAEFQLQEANKLIAALIQNSEKSNMPAEEKLKEFASQYALATKRLNEAKASTAKMDKLKHGSVANVSQITTISKLRIKEPVTPHSVLYGVKVSLRDMEQIKLAIQNLYISKGSQ